MDGIEGILVGLFICMPIIILAGMFTYKRTQDAFWTEVVIRGVGAALVALYIWGWLMPRHQRRVDEIMNRHRSRCTVCSQGGYYHE